MKRTVLVLVLGTLSGCHMTSGSGDDYPVGGGGGGTVLGGGGGGGGGTGDGGLIDGTTGDAGTLINGRVCLLTDLRRVGDATACATTGASGLTVSLGTRTALTGTDGSFAIIAPAGNGLVWRVIGDAQHPLTESVMGFGTDPTIPALTDITYINLLNQNAAVVNEQQGSVVVRVLSNGAPVTKVTATSSPATAGVALYDGNDSVIWNDGVSGTGARGMVWFPGVPLGNAPPTTATIALTLTGTTPPVTTSVPDVLVEDQAITFVTQDLQ
ncbi:MAG TPA: hypothetical protein VH165_18410 [Kofleriaceae bacterium]|nr:hypothetical protein [Kofleriaceae bacterium]